MPFVYSAVDSLDGKNKVGNGECAVLVQYYVKVGLTKTWKAGAKVLGNANIQKGTAIATFVNGKYPNTHRHAAFYVHQDANYIYVIDQWANDEVKPKISLRRLKKKGGMLSDGTYPDASNNAEAFYIIEKE